MNHITRWKRNTRIMWTVWSIIMVALLATLSNMAGLPAELPIEPVGCSTDTDCGCIYCLDSQEQAATRASDNLHLSIKGE